MNCVKYLKILNFFVVRAKTKFVKVNPSIVSLKHFPCLSKVFPSLSEVPFHPKSGKTRPGIFDNFKC